MISRKSTKLIGEIYAGHFTTPATLVFGPKFRAREFYDFLYEREYDTGFLYIVEQWGSAGVLLTDGIKRIHTGQSLSQIAASWDPKLREQWGQTLLRKLAGDVIQLFSTMTPPSRPKDVYDEVLSDYQRSIFESFRRPFDMVEQLKKQLELDGYFYRDGTLFASDTSVVHEKEEQGILELLIDKLKLTDKPIIIKHLALSEEHYLTGKWGDSISNSRHFLEAILQSIAIALHGKLAIVTPVPDRPVLVRNFLQTNGLIDESEKEALSKVYGLISHTGGHPNMAEKDQARLMRHLSLTFSQYALLTFERYLKDNP
jgi:hypothetical protein